MTEQPNACAYCGEAPSMFHNIYGEQGNFTSICCEGKKCEVRPMLKIHRKGEDSKEVAIRLWNTRPLEDVLRAENTELKRVLNGIESSQGMPIVSEDCKTRGDIVERAESLLAGITQGYWKDMSDHPDHISGAINCGEKHIALCGTFQSTDPQYRVTPEKTRANATFIATAPELVRWLCEEVKRLEKQVARLEGINKRQEYRINAHKAALVRQGE